MRVFIGAGRFALLLLVITASACRGCAGQRGETSAAPEPVEECQQYEDTLNACLHQHASVARQPTLLPKSDEERQRIKAFCADNLRRIRLACR